MAARGQRSRLRVRPRPSWVDRGDLRQRDLMSRSRRAARWLQPGLVVKRWMLTSGIGLVLALLGAAVWADLQPIYWTLQSVRWLLQTLTQVLPREITGPLVLLTMTNDIFWSLVTVMMMIVMMMMMMMT